MAEIKVTSGELRNKASELRGLNNNLKKAVTDLNSQEQQLVGMWDGETKDAFHNAFNKDKSQMDNFSQVIEQYCAALENNASRYEQAEGKNLNTATTRTY